MSEDFGYFLITIGLMWIILVTPFDASFMRNNLTLPLGLIVIGILIIILGAFHIRHVSGILFAIFIALMIKSWTFPFMDIPFMWMHEGLTETSFQSFTSNNEKIISYSCGVCNDVMNASGSNELTVNVRHPKGLRLEAEENASSINLRINYNQSINGWAESRISLPAFSKSIEYSVGAGGLTLNPENLVTTESLGLSTGAGSLKLDLGRMNTSSVKINTGVGSINLDIPEVHGLMVINASTGVGSIEITLGEGVEYLLDLNKGLGSVDNKLGSVKSAGYDTASSRVLITASTGIGSVKVERRD